MENIKTGVDRLITIIQEQKSVDLDKVSNELGVSELIVRKWAEFLEEDNIITIKYTVFLKITLSKGNTNL